MSLNPRTVHPIRVPFLFKGDYMAEQVEMLAVYYAGNRTHKGKPSAMVSRDGANDLIISGLAEWTNAKCKSIKLKRTEAEIKLRDLSCVLGPNFIFGVASGEKRFCDLFRALWPAVA